jgi:hypothetical protein
MKITENCSSCNKKIRCTAQICQFCRAPHTPKHVENNHVNQQISLILHLIQSHPSYEAVATKLNDSGNERIDNRPWTPNDIKDIYNDFLGKDIFKNGKWRPCPLCSEDIEVYSSSCRFCKSKVPKIYTTDPFANRQVIKIISLSDTMNEIEIIGRLRSDGERRVDGREWLPSDILEIKKEFNEFEKKLNKKNKKSQIPNWFMVALWGTCALFALVLLISFFSAISSPQNYTQPTKASQSRYNQNMFLATTSENLTNADLAWHALNTYGWDCSEVTARSTSNGSYYIITCSSGRQLRVYPRAGQHPRITNMAGNYR